MLLLFKRFILRLKIFLPAPIRKAIKPFFIFAFQKFLMALPAPGFPVIKPVNGVRFEFDVRSDVHARQMYFNLYEENVRYAMKEILRPGDTFIDVGAGIGYLTAFGAGLVGKGGEVHSFEPVPSSFLKLEKVAAMNREYKIFPSQYALGEKEGRAVIYIAKDHSVNNSIVHDFISPGMVAADITVPMRRLDSYIKENELRNIKLIKIDVEGYEFSVLKGLENFFLECKSLPLVICEVCPPVASLLSYTIEDFFSYMKKFSYEPFDLFHFNQKLSTSLIKQQHSIDLLFKNS